MKDLIQIQRCLYHGWEQIKMDNIYYPILIESLNLVNSL